MTLEELKQPAQEEPTDSQRLISDIRTGKSELSKDEKLRILKAERQKLSSHDFKNPIVKKEIDRIDHLLMKVEASPDVVSSVEAVPAAPEETKIAAPAPIEERPVAPPPPASEIGAVPPEGSGQAEKAVVGEPSVREEKPTLAKPTEEELQERERAAADKEEVGRVPLKGEAGPAETTGEGISGAEVTKEVPESEEEKIKKAYLSLNESALADFIKDYRGEIDNVNKAIERAKTENPDQVERLEEEKRRMEKRLKISETVAREKGIPIESAKVEEKGAPEPAGPETAAGIPPTGAVTEPKREPDHEEVIRGLSEEEAEFTDIPGARREGEAPPAEVAPKGKKGLIERFKESVVGRKLRGEHVSAEEMKNISNKEKYFLKAGKAAEMISSTLGWRILLRLPEWYLKGKYSEKEIARIKGVYVEETGLREELESSDTDEKRKAEIRSRLNELGVSETEAKSDKVNRRFGEIEVRIKESKYLSEEKRARLQEKLEAIKSKWTTSEELTEKKTMDEVDLAFEKFVGERVKGRDLVKDAFDLGLVSVGGYAFRPLVRAGFRINERYRKMAESKKEGEEVEFLKEISRSAKETLEAMVMKGKLKEDESKGKRALAAWGKVIMNSLVPISVAMMGYSEYKEGIPEGAFTKAIGHIKERVGEIDKDWSQARDAGDYIKAFLKTFNLQESVNRLTLGKLWKEEVSPETGGIEEVKPETLRAPGAPAEVPQETSPPAPEASGGFKEVSPEVFGPKAPGGEMFGPEVPVPGGMGSPESILKEIGVADSTAQAELAAKFGHDRAILYQARETFAGAGLTPEESVGIIQHAANPQELQETLSQLKAETALGVNSFNQDGLSPEELDAVSRQLRGANSEMASNLLATWQEKGNITEEAVSEIKGLVAAEEALGVNSFEGKVSPEELDKVIAGLTSANKEQADALLVHWQEKGLVDAQKVMELRFPVEHASLEHAGFQTEVTDGKVNIALDLGKEGAPQYAEQVFYRMAIENRELGEEITNVEGAQILNVGANLRELSEGHNVAGVAAEDFQKYVHIVGGKVTISDYDGFKTNILDRLTTHSQEIITPENLENCGAPAYLNNIRHDTMVDMVKPEGISEQGIQLDQEQIHRVEGRLFQATLEKSGQGEFATDIQATSEDAGTFNVFGETVSVKGGNVVAIGDTPLEHPFDLGSEAGGDRLLEEAARAHAEGIIEEMQPRQIETLVEEYDTSQDFDDALDDLGYGKDGPGAAEWEYLRGQSTEDLLNKEIESHASKGREYIEMRHQRNLRNYIQSAIKEGKIEAPGGGGSSNTIEETMEEILRAEAREEITADLDSADKILASGEKLEPEGAKAFDTLEHDVSKLVSVGTKGRATLSLNLEHIQSKQGTEILKTALEADGGNPEQAQDIKREIEQVMANSEGVSQKQTLAKFLEHHTQDETVKSAVVGFRPEEVPSIPEAGETAQAGDFIEIKGGGLPENVKVTATPEAQKFLTEHNLRIENGKLIGLQGMEIALDESQPGLDEGITESVKMEMAENGNLRAQVIDTDDTEDILEITPEGKLVPIQGIEQNIPEAASIETAIPEHETGIEADAAAKGEQLNSFTSPEGNRIDFQYNEKGEITGLNSSGTLSGRPEILKDDYRKIIFEGGKGDVQSRLMATRTVEVEARHIDLEKNILRSMEQAGKGNTSEAEFLRKNIENLIHRVEGRYGDVFEETSAGIESTPVEQGLESDINVNATPEEVDVALDHLTMSVPGMEKLSLEGIKTMDDATALTQLKEGSEGMLKEIPALINEGEDAVSLKQLERAYQAVLATVNERLGELEK